MSLPVPRRLPELEGLRGLLSWWVVICHTLQQAGYSEAGLGRGLRILLRGDYAVDVFILLSGFVIHKLWHDAREPYGAFIARRFLRLWPAYAVCMLGALAVRPCIAIILSHAPLGGPAATTAFRAIEQQNWQYEQDHFATHLIAHVPMLHGMIPDTILPRSAVAILGPAWSISLEWQFYLVAPLLFWLLLKGRSLGWGVFAVVAGLGWMHRYTPPLCVWFPMEAFLPQKLLLFGIGMVSHEIWRAVHGSGDFIAPALWGLSALVLFITLSIPFALWLGVLATVFAPRGWLKSLLNSRPIQALGQVSYSTYLGHMLVLWALQPLIFRALPSVSSAQMLIALTVLGAPLILILSLVLHRWVEAPAIQFGRRFSHR
jgi:peptidoglycan/LPS O-acetylase OafA/YrhL